mmetsp:Transcript_34022/g.75422  ORF Transcript_34022/g.75422 Transcript_34022/m.75422 type:complete len:197 (-) Transcript_34022:546-1136(-)
MAFVSPCRSLPSKLGHLQNSVPFALNRSGIVSKTQIVRAMATAASSSGDWHERIITDPAKIRAIATSANNIAVLGIKTEKQAEQPSYYVPEYLHNAGVNVVPVPVFYPEVTEILGKQVYRKVADVPVEIDILDVFRKPSDIPAHVPDILAAKPKVVWLQSGIRNHAVEAELAQAGITVVADKCLMVEHRAGRMSSL